MTTVTKPGDDGLSDLDKPAANEDPVKVYLRTIGKIPVLTAEQEVELSKAIEAGLFAEHKLETCTGLDEDYRRDLELVAAEGVRAKALMIESNLKLVVSVAKKYAVRGTGTLHFLDVIQEGNLGVIHAVEKFDFTKGYKFSTYAMWWIRQSITRGLADSARTIRVPVHMLETLNKLARVERQLAQLLGPDLTDEDIAAEMGITVERLDELRLIDRIPISIDAAAGADDDNSSLATFLEDVLGTRPEDAAVLGDEVARILATLERSFSDREATIIRMRLGFHDGEFWLLEDVAKHFGITPERIRQLQRNTLRKLRVLLGVPAQAAS